MNLLLKLKAKKNTDRLLNICNDLIDNYEKENNTLAPSCKNDLITLLKKRFEAAKQEISEWEDYDTNYVEIAHSMLCHASYDLLASGKYNLYPGILNPMSCASNLMKVYNKAMEYAVTNHLISQEVKENELNNLYRCIADI